MFLTPFKKASTIIGAELDPIIQSLWPGLAHSGSQPDSLYVFTKPFIIFSFKTGYIILKKGNTALNVSQKPLSVNI